MFMQYLDPQSSFSQVLGGALSSTNIPQNAQKIPLHGKHGQSPPHWLESKTCWKLPKPLIKYTEKHHSSHFYIFLSHLSATLFRISIHPQLARVPANQDHG